MERILVRIDIELSETPGYIVYNLVGVICYAAKLAPAPYDLSKLGWVAFISDRDSWGSLWLTKYILYAVTYCHKDLSRTLLVSEKYKFEKS
jgi:hypothetical protein